MIMDSFISIIDLLAYGYRLNDGDVELVEVNLTANDITEHQGNTCAIYSYIIFGLFTVLYVI